MMLKNPCPDIERLRRIAMIVVAIAGTMSAPVGASVHNVEKATDALRKTLAAWRASVDSSQLVFDHHVFGGFSSMKIGQGLSQLPLDEDEASQKDQQWIVEQQPLDVSSAFFRGGRRFMAARSGHLYRIDSERTHAHPGLDPMKDAVGDVEIVSSTLSSARAFVHRLIGTEDEFEVMTVDPPFPRRYLGGAHMMAAYGTGWGLLGTEATMDYLRVLDEGLSPTSAVRDGEHVRWRCRLPGPSGHPAPDTGEAGTEFVFLAAAAPPWELQEIQIRIYRELVQLNHEAPPSGPELVAIGSIRFPEGIGLPCGAAVPPLTIIEHVQLRESETESLWGVDSVRIREVRPLSNSDPQFFVPQPVRSDTRGADMRFDVTFQLGRTWFAIDGREMESHRPVDLTILTNLQYWLERGRFVEFDEEQQ